MSRFDITEFVGDLFSAPASRAALVSAARRRGARPAVLLVLNRLPDRVYRGLEDLWREVPALTDSYDPWEDCP